MESNKLTTLDNKLPLKAYPEKKLDEVLKTEFMFWIANLLSLKADKQEIVLNALNEVKYHFHSLGLDDVKKAFTMYARAQLSIKPISNHFDVVLVSQIFQEYKSIKPRKKPKVEDISEEEKKKLTSSGMKKCLEYYEENNKILDGYNLFLYDVFYHDGYLPKDNETKNKAIKDAKQFFELNYTDKKAKTKQEYTDIKNILKSINNPKSTLLIVKAKELIVQKFLRELYRDEKKVNQLKKRYE